MKPDIIHQLESQIGRPLNQLPAPEDLADSIRHQSNRSYVLLDGDLVALNLSEEESLTDILFDKDACNFLQYLNLSDNKNLQKVSFTAVLPNLKFLNLSGCRIDGLSLPAGCHQLEKAWLQKSGLQTMSFAGPCPNLLLLDLSGNRLEQLVLPGGFDSLAYLYLAENRLKQLVFAPKAESTDGDGLRSDSPLPSLATLHLGKNNLEHLLENIVFSEQLTTLYLAENTPKNIPKVLLGSWDMFTVENCLEDVRTWFTEITTRPHEKNRAVKLMLTGNGNVGKSTLACSMRNGRCDHNPESTHGILIDTLEKKDITYNIWDFGGQEIYHGTHRLFISSAALQVIVFDSETEKNARHFKPEKDRIRDEPILPHRMEYWYETTKKLSPDSQFFIVQNKKYEEEDDMHAVDYARDKARFVSLNAKSGEDVDDLLYFLRKLARNLPDYDMIMPESWLKVRQFFIDNLQAKNNKKIISEEEFIGLCIDNEVMEKARPLLFKYLHHNGYLYSHENLGDHIIADQRWALEAIYKPYDRRATHYDVFINLEGKIEVGHLFQVFGDEYTVDEKRLFLDFMKSCGLCFQLNEKPRQKSNSEKDIYVFPEFLPDTKPKDVNTIWQCLAKDVRILRYRLPWLNYYVIQTFITALGRKTETKHFWRYGIHITTPEGFFKVELDYVAKALMLHIQTNAMAAWLVSILDELKVDHGTNGWEISTDGAVFQPFNPEEWQARRHSKIEESRMSPEGESLTKRLPDKEQSVNRQVILFFAANPTDDNLHLRSEHSHIDEMLKEDEVEDKCKIIPKFGTSPGQMVKVISDYRPAIVHFAGHGEEVNPDTGRGGGIVLHTDDYQGRKEMDAEKLGKIFSRIKKNNPKLRIVFLNACYTEPQAIAISKQDIYTIGTNDKLNSEAARLFAAYFYRQYALSQNIRDAFDIGLQAGLSADKNIESLVHLFHKGRMIGV